MKTLKSLFGALAVSLPLCALATADVTVTAVESVSGIVTVKYTLTEDAVVTPRFFVGGEWVAPQFLTLLSGDINKKVAATTGSETRSFVWSARQEAWPDAARKTYADAKVELKAWALGAPPPYMVVDLGTYGQPLTDVPHYYATKADVPGGITNRIYMTEKLLMFKVPARHVTWWMGCIYDRTKDDQCQKNERYHQVVFSDDYYIGVYEVTQAQGLRLFNERCQDSRFYANTHTPEENDFRPFCGRGYDWLRGSSSTPGSAPQADSKLDQLRVRYGISFDLPTEAQWEFACRAGVANSYVYGSYAANSKNTWTVETSDYNDGDGQLTRPVNRWSPNNWDLYDMPGNVFELCRDLWTEYEYRDGVPVLDPIGANPHQNAIARGGAYNNYVTATRSPFRHSLSRTSTEWGMGVRLSCPAVAL